MRAGVFMGILVGVLTIPLAVVYPPAERALTAPATWLADTWHGSEFPPQGDAALMLPFLACIVQWFALGLIIGLVLRYRNKHANI